MPGIPPQSKPQIYSENGANSPKSRASAAPAEKSFLAGQSYMMQSLGLAKNAGVTQAAMGERSNYCKLS